MKKRALITGICGQDGSWLTELLLSKDYDVFGLKRRTSSPGFGNISHLLDQVTLIDGDLLDQISLNNAIKISAPDEIYHLGAQSHVGTSFKQPSYTMECTGHGTLKLLEAIREFCPTSRLYFAGSSEQFGGVSGGPYSETSERASRSPYASAKEFGYITVKNYRESYGIYACAALLFNHSSTRRSEEFATRKITKAAARIKLGLQDKLTMGNIDTFRDEGHSKDYVEAMWLMLQQDKPDDFVISTDETHSIREMIDLVFSHVGLNYQDHLEIDPAFFRPAEVNILLGDSSKARRVLGWKPKYTWKTLLIEMVENDLSIEGRGV
jgi:GDPmannose 4,6-dehydratase